MKKECDIVKDLLFSYNDNVLNDTSKEFVKEHLENCESCKEVLQEIQKESQIKKSSKEIDFFKNIRKKINKKNIVICISIILLLLLILFNLLVFKNYNETTSTMEIYLQDDITQQQLQTIQDTIIALDNTIEFEYISKEEALKKMKNNLGKDSYLLDGYEKQNPLPALFEIKTTTKIQSLVDKMKNMPGIARINTHLNYNPYLLFISKIWKD